MPQCRRHKHIPRTPPSEDPPPVIRAAAAFQQELISRLEDLSIVPTREEVLIETMATARMAAISGDLATAIKGYTAVGNMMGMSAASNETHNHLHVHRSAADMLAVDDGVLADLIAAAKATPTIATVRACPQTTMRAETVDPSALLA